MEEMKSEDCGPGCNCGKPSGNKKLKAVICIIVLLAVCGILVYKAKNGKQTAPVNASTAFAGPVVIEANEVNQPKSAIATDKQQPIANAIEEKKSIGDALDSISLLNRVAANQDAVFVFIPAKNSDVITKDTFDAIASAQKKIESSGAKLGLYTLQSTSPEYSNIAAQMPLPGILVMSKGKGMGAVSGGITEDKILQAYVASSRAGGCGSSSSCSPSTPGCGPTPIGHVRVK